MTAGSFKFLTFRFMPVSDQNRYENGDSEIVWAITFDADTDNKKNENFILNSASKVEAVLGASIAIGVLLSF